ncbi:MAG: glycosyltransferase family 2 protein [Bacteroidota bacterium]|jgi:glycosyltransferase involved in cell wall biosynthesis|nr:glycosyltransferase family 2 protein [Bacteroidota bacterium]
MHQLSAVIITLNEARNLEQCLQSLEGIADEIIVLDSFSTDATLAIAKKYNCHIVQEKFIGFGPQKNKAIALASNDWILSIDADECLSEALRMSLLNWKQSKANGVLYAMNRRTNYAGHWIRFCGWYPDTLLRLFNRHQAQFSSALVHEEVIFEKHLKVLPLKGDILHYSFPFVFTHLRKIVKYAAIGAEHDIQNGKNCSAFKYYIVPLWIFITQYIIKLGILDGKAGWKVCYYSALAAKRKYGFIRNAAK